MQKSLTTKQQYWSELIAQADSFEGSLADFARSQGVPAKTLYRWRHCLRQREVQQHATKTVFTQVVSSSLSTGPSLTLESGELQLRFSQLPEPRWLAQFLLLSRGA